MPRHINGRLGSPIVLNLCRESIQSATWSTILLNLILKFISQTCNDDRPRGYLRFGWLSSSCCFPVPFTYFDGCIAAMAQSDPFHDPIVSQMPSFARYGQFEAIEMQSHTRSLGHYKRSVSAIYLSVMIEGLIDALLASHPNLHHRSCRLV